MATDDQLLVVIDPLARRTDGEAVRIAKDVLSAGAASTKVCLPEGPEEFARALSRRGSRRPVVIGDDRALLRAVALLHRRRELAACALSLIPVGSALGLAHSLGVPAGAVAAARAALDGVEHRLDLLVDDSDGVVLGTLRIPVLPGAPPPDRAEGPAATDTGPGSGPGRGTGPGTGAGTGTDRGPGAEGAPTGDPSHGPHFWQRAWPQSLARTLSTRPTRPARLSRPLRPSRIRVATGGGAGPSRLRVEVDGILLIDLDQPVEAVSITPCIDGGADIEIRPVSVGAEAAPLHAVGHRVTVSGADFRYRADSLVAGPVRTRTWTVREGAWGLTLPG
ncbi:diacylglycerol kinase family protein [Streptomyces europaeiscabiei]|uniref:diacylglycerol kinase n=1 Tax=Streptomyces europaeiscabiei TaxID=146819 RepID=UPI0029B62B57|nr:diacylglycerol kinase [Streptomyces europaeiscabiei]MDX3587480.1 diacylglycerol kinase [Streptomyces europaeiscabiei]MDX3631741.1 diacylglycerol kinase [Streptomyces europaeiscabiei]MDX3649522.1 diacylglycerol kinase [Streptomyces europaeiscabiei]